MVTVPFSTDQLEGRKKEAVCMLRRWLRARFPAGLSAAYYLSVFAQRESLNSRVTGAMAERSYAIFAITFAETETVKLFALFIGCGHAQRTRASERASDRGEKGKWSSPVPTDQSGQFMHGESLRLSTNESCSYSMSS